LYECDLQACGALAESAAPVGHLDGDTAISAGTFGAALSAAGAVCRAVDRVVCGEVRADRDRLIKFYSKDARVVNKHTTNRVWTRVTA